jgi:HK97 family phage major capsid protein
MPTATPTRADELVDVLAETGPQLDDKAKAAIAAYVQNSIDDGFSVKLDERLQAERANWAREQLAQDGARPNVGAAKAKGHNPKASGAVLDGKFESAGDLLCTLYNARRGDAKAGAKLGELRNAFSSTVPSEGGFLVPEEFRAEMLRIALEGSLVRSRARTIPMAVPRIKFPMIDSTSNATNVYGGVTGYWSEEGGTITNSSATFGTVTLDAQKLVAGASIPNELLSDSAISVSAFIDQVFPEALRWFEDIAFIRGTGVGEPLGFLNAGNTAQVSVAKESGQAADTIVWENLVKMYSRMLPTSLGSAVWFAHIDTLPELATMALSVGTGGAPVWHTNGAQGFPMSILGRPVIFTEKLETLGDAGDIVFADLSYYLIGDRQQMTAMTSEHVNFTTDTTAYRLIERVDGRPWLKTAITPHKGTNTLSPFVKLAARA